MLYANFHISTVQVSEGLNASLRGFETTDLAPVVRRLDNAIQRINGYHCVNKTNHATRWIVIYPVDSIYTSFELPGPELHVSRLNNTVYWITCFPVDKSQQNKPCHPLDSDLFSGLLYPPFEQPRPDFYQDIPFQRNDQFYFFLATCVQLEYKS